MTLLGLLDSEILGNDHDEPYAWRLAPARTDWDPEASGAEAPEQKAPARCSSTHRVTGISQSVIVTPPIVAN